MIRIKRRVFQGWWESSDGRVRLESRGCGTWSIYERNGRAYMHDAIVSARTARQAYEQWLRDDNETGDEK